MHLELSHLLMPIHLAGFFGEVWNGSELLRSMHCINIGSENIEHFG